MIGNGTGYIGQLPADWYGKRWIPRDVLHTDCGMTTTYVDVEMGQNVVIALTTDGRIRGWVSQESRPNCRQRWKGRMHSKVNFGKSQGYQDTAYGFDILGGALTGQTLYTKPTQIGNDTDWAAISAGFTFGAPRPSRCVFL